MMVRRSLAMATLVVIAVLVMGVVVFRGPLLRRGIEIGAGLATGSDVRVAKVTAGASHATILGAVAQSKDGEPVFSCERIDLAYALRGAFGGPHPFGISAVALDRPRLALIHHRDGTWNVRFPAGGGQAGGALAAVRLRVRDGDFALSDETRLYAHSRRLELANLRADVTLDPAARSNYDITLVAVEQAGRFPISGRGTLDGPRGYELQRWTAPRLGIAPLVDYAVNAASFHVADGTLQDVDALIYGLRSRDGSIARHLSATADLEGFRLYLGGLAAPLRDGRGPLQAYDDGLAIPRVVGTFAGVPLTVAGVIYSFADPAVRLGIVGRGDLRRFASAAAARIPISGPLAADLLVEGQASRPLTLAHLTSPALRYAGVPLRGFDGLVALEGTELDIARGALRYGPASLSARGRVSLEGARQADIVVDLSAPAAGIPYLAYTLPGMMLRGTALLGGANGAFSASGVITGAGPGDRLDGGFRLASNGTGSAGPLELEGPGRQALYARAALDGPHVAAAYVEAHGLRLGSTPAPPLPGLHLLPLPPANGELDADLAGAMQGQRYALAGDARVAGRLRDVPLGALTARGIVEDGLRTAIAGRYDGSLASLGALTGKKLPARGTVSIPLAVLAAGPSRVLVQIRGAQLRGVDLGGVRLEDLQATVGVRPRALDLYAARVRLDGHDVVAQGRLGEGGTLVASANGLDLAPLHRMGLPLEQGRVTAVATVGGTPQAPTLDGGLIGQGQFAGLPVSASTDVALAGDRLTLSDGLLQAGAAVGMLEGEVNGLRTRPQRASYAFRARVRDADVASLTQSAEARLQYPEGALDADVNVRGTGPAPTIAGSLAIPEGSLNGLSFRDAALSLDGTPQAVALNDGHVTVGTSTVTFDGALSTATRTQRLALRAPRIDLADFNDYFDRGDTLGGRGSISLSVRNAPDALAATGRANVRDTRFRRLALGTTQLAVDTSGRTIRTAAAIGGSSGRVALNGTVQLPAGRPLDDTLRRSAVDLDFEAKSVALGTWLPVLGYRQPVVGFVDARANVRGRYPALNSGLHAAVTGGRVGRIPIQRLTVAASAARGRVTVGSAVLEIPGLSADAAGSFGLRPGDPLALTARAAVPDVGALYATVSGNPRPDFGGAVGTTLQVRGTPQKPVLHDRLDLNAARYRTYTVPHAYADLTATTSLLSLERAEVDFAGGRITGDGHAPIVLHPQPGIGPADQPVSLELSADRVDLAQFVSLLPKGTDLAGLLAGRLALLGTIAQPRLDGTLAVVDFAYASPQERAKLTGGAAQLTLNGTAASLHDTHVDVGGGTISARASASVPSLRAPGRDLTFNFQATAAHAGLDVPAYFRGKVDGAIALARAPGSQPTLVGDLTFNDTRIPLTALLVSSPSPAPSATPSLPDVALKLAVTAARDVRVQSGQVDIGARGRVVAGGTLHDPTLAGRLVATGGTIDFYRTFTVSNDSTVTFHRSLGVIPSLDAYATTSIPDPPTQVSLHVTGPATQMNVALQSDPAYSREQIVGLLAGLQNLGAVQGVAPSQGQGNQNVLGNIAENQLGTMLTRNLLEPFSAQLGSAIGLSSLSLGYTPGTGLGLGAQKTLFKNLDAVFSQSFNYPQRQSIGLRASPSVATAVQLTFFNQQGSGQFSNAPGSVIQGDPAITASQPANGTNGFAFSLQRKFR
jgi:hypothetical protein